jgi:hypothetical protein
MQIKVEYVQSDSKIMSMKKRRKLHNEDLHILYPSPNAVRVTK